MGVPHHFPRALSPCTTDVDLIPLGSYVSRVEALFHLNLNLKLDHIDIYIYTYTRRESRRIAGVDARPDVLKLPSLKHPSSSF